jgi:hypothetical protein
MINIDDFLVKENDRFIVDLENWGSIDISFEDGDRVRFKYDGKKYIGTLSKIGKDENLYEMIDLKEL